MPSSSNLVVYGTGARRRGKAQTTAAFLANARSRRG